MKKLLIISALVGMTSLSLKAQEPLKVRAEVGLNLATITATVSHGSSSFTGANGQTSLTGLRLGIGLEKSFSNPSLYAYGMLGYRGSGTTMKQSALDDAEDFMGISYQQKSGKINLDYLNLGAGLGYRFNLGSQFSLSPEAGLTAGYAVSMKMLGESPDKEDEEYLNRFELGWSLSAKLQYQRYYLRAGYERAFTPWYSSGDGGASIKMYNKAWVVTAGIYF